MKKKNNVKNIIEYAIIIALYYVTGGAFSYSNYSVQITVFFLISLLICAYYRKLKKVFHLNVFIPWTSMIFFVMLVPLFFNDSVSTYIAIAMQISIGMFCAMIIPKEEFVRKYINVIVVFAAISVIAYSISLVSPTVAQLFPLTVGSDSVDYYNAGVYVFMKVKSYSSFTLMMRNAGICWEPGCYQCFLNIALLFLCERERCEHQQYFYIKLFILVITIITTVSTTGIIILVLVLLFYSRQWCKGLKWGWVFLPTIIFAIWWMYQHFELNSIFQYKLEREFGESLGFLDRISLNRLSYVFSESGWPYFFGMSFAKWLTYDKSLWNSIIHSLLCLGTPFTLIQLMGYWLGSRTLVKKGNVLFLIMIMCASTETLFWRVLFNTIAFYGWFYCSKKVSRSKVSKAVGDNYENTINGCANY